ncbi:GAF domain-containing sensor histidine kinase [Streptomyces sp. XD-27]|uniref:sensor histidine kinase n=1 Tax=Streptomyces sp. XD-27 TaxID=3062779 RepID=UPI0026F41C5A|nr:GAF domain-containing sensor histidine kinase [Streptomyces sp. XD-27]WKX68991.1 GAF domain-containing sensor histidine kinase [Streptomyces sp. XD-27]
MGSADEGRVHVPQLRLDELLEELQARLNAVRETRDRVHGLFEAVLSVGSGLDLEHVLRRIVEEAVSLVDAEYGALGVIGPGGKIVQFLPVGVSEEQIAAIGPFPSGHGILGELIRHPEPLRLPKLSEHPASYGFPAHHPPMDTFLGVPIRVGDQVFGNLYLTEKRGGAEFDAEDESLLSTLAVAAGVAIDNARLYEEGRRRERWLRANAEITYSLMSGKPRSEVMGLIAESAKEITDAALAMVALPMTDTSTLSVEFVLGEGAEALRGLVLPVEGSLIGTAFSTVAPVTSADVSHGPRVFASPLRVAGLGPAVAVPIGTGSATGAGVRGVLLLARASGRPGFAEEETEPLMGFAGQAAVAMELAERRRDAEQVALLEERDRIARDLHDLAIQRLFATGMTLQSAARVIDHPGASERVLRAVRDLDDTIKIIRSTIFGLRSHQPGAGQNLRARVVQAVGEATPVLGFAPSLRMEGLLDTQVPREVADQVVPVLSEALANVARHAHAARVDVVLGTDGDELTLTVTDDGTGIPPEGRRSGLRNLAERAERLGGELQLSAPPGGGTVLTWRVPVS